MPYSSQIRAREAGGGSIWEEILDFALANHTEDQRAMTTFTTSIALLQRKCNGAESHICRYWIADGSKSGICETATAVRQLKLEC